MRRLIRFKASVDMPWPMRISKTIPSNRADFADIVALMKSRYDLRVKRWRTNMSGCAWRVYHHDGRVMNYIESPVPKTPISLAIFLHEVGHHVIGFDRYKKRCEEEYHAWMWAMKTMRQFGIEPDARVNRR